MKSPSRMLGRVAGQVKGPFAQVQADVIPGNRFSAEGRLQSALAACPPVACVLFCL